MSPQVLEKISYEGNIKQSLASQFNVEGPVELSVIDTAQDREEQFEAPMYLRNSNNQYNYDYYYNLNLNAIPAETLEANQEERPTTKVKRSMQFRAKFWTIVFSVAALPLLNSALYNAYALSKNIAQQVILTRQLESVLHEKQDLEAKLHESSSDTGLKRVIKQEMNLVETNEIVVKIVQS